MGTCISKKKESPVFYKRELKRPPDDIEFYPPETDSSRQIMRFQGSLSNVKIEGDATKPYGINFQISDNMMKAEFPLAEPEYHQSKSILWKIREENFQFQANHYQIRTQILHIKIFSLNNEEIQSLQINLYKIITGPIKNNFKIPLQNGKFINLIYDLKISQILKMQVKVKSAQLWLKNQHPGENFNFTMEWILTENGKNSRKVMTKPSSSKSTLITQQSIAESFTDDPEQPVSIDKGQGKKKSLKASQSEKLLLQWKDSQSLPEISFNLTADQINGSLFLFHCWKVLDKDQSDGKQVMHRFANFRMTLHQFIQLGNSESTNDNKNNDKDIQFDEQIWSNGVHIGRCKCKIQMNFPHFFRQLHSLTRTEKGVFDIEIDNFRDEEETTSLQSYEKIKPLHQKLLLIKGKFLQNFQSYFSKKVAYKQAVSVMSQISKQIRMIRFNSQKFQNNIKALKQLTERQLFLLQIINTVYNFLTEEDRNITDESWRLINLLFSRDELQLKNIGFTEQQISELKQCTDVTKVSELQTCSHKGKQKYHKLLNKKMRIGLQFRRLLFNCLIQSLNEGISMIDQNERQLPNSQIFKGECFLRIPIFRQFVLKKIQSASDLDYSQFEINEREWLKSKIQIKERQSQIFKELQWDRYLYCLLNLNPDAKTLQEELYKAFEDSVWTEQISQRGILFFIFFRIMMQKYSLIQSKFKIPKYQYFSGYNRLVTAFLNQIKNRSLMNFPQSLIKSSMSLLHNEDLQQPILLLLAKNTNYFDVRLVLKCLSIFRLYIKYLTQGRRLLPLSFCYGVFIKIVKKILKSDSQNCVAAVLLIIYESYQKLEPQFKTCLTLYFLGSKFFPLFYHWSYVVRSIFHHFIILKISQNKELFQSTTKIQIKLRKSYDQALNQLQQMQQKSLCIDSGKRYQIKKSGTYYLKMRNKMKKIKQVQKNKLSHNQLTEEGSGTQILTLGQRKLAHKFLSTTEYQNNNQLDVQRIKWPQILDYKRKEKILNSSCETLTSEQQIWVRSKSLLGQEQLPQILPIKFNNKQYTYHESAKYNGAFTQNEFILTELTVVEKNQISISHQQFQKINTQITNNFIETRELPHIPLQTYAFFEYGDLEVEDIESFSF